MNLKTITAGMSEKGAAFVTVERNRLRKAFMQGRQLGKISEWLPTDDAALDAFDIIVEQMAKDAGLVAPQQTTYTVESAPADIFEAEAARRGMRLIPTNKPFVQQHPAGGVNTQVPPVSPPNKMSDDLDNQIAGVVAEGRNRSGVTEKP